MSRFTDSIEHELEGIRGVNPGIAAKCCDTCTCYCEQDPCECIDEGGFSWSACDSCGSTYGGDRYDAHGFIEDDNSVIHLSICVDCLCFHANGDEPEIWSAHPGEKTVEVLL